MPVIGRDSSADIVIPLPQVSSRHALIEPAGPGRFRVKDLGSANGTFVDRQRITEAIVAFGADLRLGSAPFDWQALAPQLNAGSRATAGLVLGRDPGCDLVVPDARVSSRHLQVVPQGGRIEVTDLGSSNGLFVNERRVQTAVVGQTDAVRLGSLPIDLFRLVAAHAPARPHAVPLAQPMPAPAQGGPYPSAPTPVAVSQSSPISATPSGMEAAASPSATPAPAASRPANSGLWTLAAVVVLALVGAGIAFATQETITKKCENCSQQVVSRRAFFWQRADVEREAAAVHWCAKCADEPVPFQKTLKCKLCGAPYSQQAMTAPRREQPKDVEQRDGFCSERCRNEQLVRDGAKGAGDIFGGVLRQLTR